MIAVEICLPADLIASSTWILLHVSNVTGHWFQTEYTRYCIEFDSCCTRSPDTFRILVIDIFIWDRVLSTQRNELVILLVFFCWCLLTGDWNTYCMVTLLEDATVFITSIFYQYFITLLILYIHFTLRSKLVCLLIARFQRAVLYVLYRVLVCVFLSAWAFLFLFFNACSLNLVLGYTVVIL